MKLNSNISYNKLNFKLVKDANLFTYGAGSMLPFPSICEPNGINGNSRCASHLITNVSTNYNFKFNKLWNCIYYSTVTVTLAKILTLTFPCTLTLNLPLSTGLNNSISANLLPLAQIKGYKNQLLTTYSVLRSLPSPWGVIGSPFPKGAEAGGANSSASLNNNSQLSLSLNTFYKFYSTNTSLKTNKTNSPSLAIPKGRRGGKINYLKGWRSNWLKKFKYIEKLDKYKLDKNDRLFISILKERKYNLNKKMYQTSGTVEDVGAVGVVGTVPNKLVNNDLELLIDNTNLSIIKPNTKQSKFTAVGKARDLFTNKFIEYKFNKSNANPTYFKRL
jgi:hypothetical protein